VENNKNLLNKPSVVLTEVAQKPIDNVVENAPANNLFNTADSINVSSSPLPNDNTNVHNPSVVSVNEPSLFKRSSNPSTTTTNNNNNVSNTNVTSTIDDNTDNINDITTLTPNSHVRDVLREILPVFENYHPPLVNTDVNRDNRAFSQPTYLNVIPENQRPTSQSQYVPSTNTNSSPGNINANTTTTTNAGSTVNDPQLERY